MPYQDKFVRVDGLKTRYIEEGSGPAVILLHGASLGSSADVFERNLLPLASAGLRVIAYDQPGFGDTDNPGDYSVAYRRRFVMLFMDALRINTAALIGHSQAGNMAVSLAFDYPQRVSKVMILGTGSLLPPLEAPSAKAPREGDEGTASEPTLEQTRALLEHNLFNHDLITPEILEKRQRMSIGKNFEAFIKRSQAAQGGGGPKEPKPMWKRLAELPSPLLLIFGKDDRGSAYQRAAKLKELYPQLNIHIADNCKHLVQWDAMDEFHRLAKDFLRPEAGK